MNRLGPYLTLRDVPLWLAVVGLGFLALSGLLSMIHDPSLTAVVVIVVGLAVGITVGGRILVRRLRYNRLSRIVIAMAALAAVLLMLPVSWVFVPAAMALLAIEMMAPRPVGAAPPPSSPVPAGPRASRDTDGFDWPEEPRAT